VTPADDLPFDRKTIETIIRTDEKVDGLTKAVDKLSIKVDGLADRFGECPCPAVLGLQDDVKTLRTANAYTTGKLAGIAVTVTAAWQFISPYLFGGR
jgi:hypothetical protein